MSEFPPSYPSPPVQPKLSASGPRDFTTLSLHKVALIAGLALATIVPTWFISDLIAERETRHGGVKKEFTRNWGPEQRLYTPVLVVPYALPSGRREFLKIGAARVDLTAGLATQERRRGLFHATVYDAKIDMQGAFLVPPESRLKDLLTDKSSRLMWEESFVVFGTTESLAGLRAEDSITINGVETPWQPCRKAVRLEHACQSASTVVAHAPLAPAETAARIPFKASVSLRGTAAFHVLNGAKELNATVRAAWHSPSFSGDALPVNFTLTPDGFTAQWETIEFGSPRMLASGTIADVAMWRGTSIGVDLIEATPIYRMINRVAKYGLLFVMLAFATYLVFELMSRLQIHIVQYGLIGLSLSLFSLLLLALAEPIGYTAAYTLSAVLVLAQSSLYTWSVARRAGPALAFAGMLASLFAFLYVLLGLETYSLLIGALALFAVVSALMVLTQKVSWPGRVVVEGAA